MKKYLHSGFIGLGAAVVFSLLYIAGALFSIEDNIYDFFLRFRADRNRINNVIFLDVDDNAIAFNGVFPWPRSVTADGILRLKEYGARAAIFDIEFIDNGPPGVDSVYLNQNLPNEFDRAFSEINAAAQGLFTALKSGRMNLGDVDRYAGDLSAMINTEGRGLLKKAQSVARDNDLYLAQASALYGKSWATLHLREQPLEGEQASRRPMAEARFSYPVQAAHNANKGRYVDVLPALPVFAEAAIGSGFTNVDIDEDGIRRRIHLAQNIYDHWYLQLAFAPLMDHFGRPDIELRPRELLIKGAQWEGEKKNIRIPLDEEGRMMLDWPRTNYLNSYRHISFADFSYLDQLEREMEIYSTALGSADVPFFTQFDPSLVGITRITGELAVLYKNIYDEKTAALENCSTPSFDAYVEGRARSRALIGNILALEPAAKVRSLAQELSAQYPASAEDINAEAEYIASLTGALQADLDRYIELSEKIGEIIRDCFCILGRVDTGTTDIGVTPFFGEYVNAGTHAVVLDTILSESFLVPLSLKWSILFTLIFVPLFFLVSAGISPLPRAITGFTMTFFIALAALLLFRFTGLFFGPTGTVLAMVSAVIFREITAYARSEREKEFIRKAFSTYVSHAVVKEILSNPKQLQLGGSKRMMSAIFTDIQGFSTISERLDPEDLVTLLNRYLAAMSDVVLAEKGTIDKFEGDAIIAFFGAPLEIPDHALRACISAITMKRIEQDMNRMIIEEKLSPWPLLTRIGINTGDMVAGNMGTENKMNYTIMGNAVNLAARLEGVNRQYGTWVLATETTVKEAGEGILYRKLDRVRVVGINEPVRLCELLETTTRALPEQQKLVRIFHEALDCFEKRDWRWALNGFREAGVLDTSGLSKKYIKRCEEFFTKPPEEDWDGVYNLTEK